MRVNFSRMSLANLAAGIATALRKVPRVEYVEVTSPPAANMPFIVRHTLGVTPVFASSMAKGNGHIYAEARDLAEWNDRQIKVRHNVANDKIIVKVEAE